MFRLFGGVHRKLAITALACPFFTGSEKRTPKTLPLNLGFDAELMYGRDPVTGEVLAVVRGVGRLYDDRANKAPGQLGDEALASGDSLGRNFWSLVHGGVVQSHGSQACVGAMEQRCNVFERVAGGEITDLEHAEKCFGEA